MLKDIDIIARTGHPKESMTNPSLIVGHSFKNDCAIFVSFELSMPCCGSILPTAVHAIDGTKHT
jgi:hypothetical protein